MQARNERNHLLPRRRLCVITPEVLANSPGRILTGICRPLGGCILATQTPTYWILYRRLGIGQKTCPSSQRTT